MADRDRDDWGREREFGDRDREYGKTYDRDRGFQEPRGYQSDRGYSSNRDYQQGYQQDRGPMSRGADEVRSWFGDDDARRRREMDEQRDASRDRGANSAQAWREHGWSGRERGQETGWSNDRGSAFGDQRDFVNRGRDWSGSQYSPRGREWDNPGYRSYENQGNTSFPIGGGLYSSNSGYPTSTGTTGRQSSYHSGGFAGRGPRGYQRSDDRVREDVNERLTADPRIDASDIDVRVEQGEVILSGTVDERRTRRLAEEIIEDLPGVRDVRNELKVNQGGRSDGSLGHTGDPQRRDDVITLNTKDPDKR